MAVHRPRSSILSLKSWLFTPATKADRFGRSAEVHADALIIDLEDAVALLDKQKARTAALQYLAQPAQGRLPCALRINAPVTRTGIEDLHSLLESSAAPDYIILPKCDSPAFVRMVRTLLDQAAKDTEIIALIESAKAVEALPDIVGSEVRPAALMFGAADMEADLGAKTGWEPLLFVRSRIVQVAASAGIVAVDSPFFGIADLEGLKKETTAARDLGFHGKAAIHPKQVSVINDVFLPSDEEVAKARQILAVNQQGVGSVDHQMVDEAIARKARRTLERAAIAAANLVTR
ncbi:MAG TPA: itaconate degradation C-C-lyase RipC [Terriglobales bacterium]|nr:itaconate degradation C-C-lyase RipC [Terriglobales bacterium]